jgi:hypothetical protein
MIPHYVVFVDIIRNALTLKNLLSYIPLNTAHYFKCRFFCFIKGGGVVVVKGLRNFSWV